MYGGPHFGGPHGPGFGGPHGPGFGGPHGPGFGGPHGPHGYYGYGHYGFYRYFKPHYSSAKFLDYMKIIESEEEGKKYYNFCGCEKCSLPFGIDYRNAKDVTYISLNGPKFIDGVYNYKDKVDGFFKFVINCPECAKETAFFVNVRTLPEFVLKRYLEQTKNIEYFVEYKFSDLNKNQVIGFDVCKNVKNLSVGKINDIVSKLDFDYLMKKDLQFEISRYQLSDIALRAYEKLSNNKVTEKPRFDVKVKNLVVNNNIFSKFKRMKHVLKTNGFSGIIRVFTLNEEDKKNLQLLIKK